MSERLPDGDDPAHATGLATVIRGASVALLGSVLGGGLGFAFSIVLARLLGQDEFGLFVLALNVVTTGSALGLAGADYAAVRFVASAATPGEKRGAMLTPVLLALALNSAVALALLPSADWIATSLLNEPRFSGPLKAAALVLPLTVTAQMLSACLSGLEHARGELARKVSEQGGRIGFAVLVVALGSGVTAVVASMAAAACIAIVVVGTLLARALPRGGPLRPLSVRTTVGFAWPQTVANASTQLWHLANVVILSHVAGAKAVALYGAADAIARLPALVYNSFAYRFAPTIARLWAEGRPDELARMLKGITRWIAVAAVPLYAVAIALPGPLLALYGSKYGEAATALAIIAGTSLANALFGPVEFTLIMTGRVRYEMAANVAAALVMTGGSILLISRYGLVGAALATTGFTFLMNMFKVVLVRRLLRMNPLSFAVLGPIAAAAAAGAAVAGLDRVTGLGDTLPGTALLGLLLIALYGLVLWRVVGISAADRRALGLALRPR